jgi:hypothetical protein
MFPTSTLLLIDGDVAILNIHIEEPTHEKFRATGSYLLRFIGHLCFGKDIASGIRTSYQTATNDTNSLCVIL